MEIQKKALRISSPDLTGYAIYEKYVCTSATPGFERLIGLHYLDKDDIIDERYETRWVGPSNRAAKEY